MEVMDRFGGLPASVWPSPAKRIVSWILPMLASIACGALAFWRGRAYAFPTARLLLWTLLGFAAGATALALMFAMIEWPAREKCSSCGRQRVVTRERCEHCSEPFAPPPLDGCEIFDTVRP